MIDDTEIKSPERRTQGDPTTVAICTISIILMILMLVKIISNIRFHAIG